MILIDVTKCIHHGWKNTHKHTTCVTIAIDHQDRVRDNFSLIVDRLRIMFSIDSMRAHTQHTHDGTHRMNGIQDSDSNWKRQQIRKHIKITFFFIVCVYEPRG